jgi:hypothetical protein
VAGLRTLASNSALRPFRFVRKTDSSTMATQIARSPNDAVRMSTNRLGRMDSRPYTNSMCTQ